MDSQKYENKMKALLQNTTYKEVQIDPTANTERKIGGQRVENKGIGKKDKTSIKHTS